MYEASNASECWHSIVLRGRNSATYKMALAWCIVQFIERGRMRVTRDELAQAFLDVYVDRLKNGMPQLSDPAHTSAMERVVHGYSSGQVDRAHAVAQVRAEAFNDVLDAFHTVDSVGVPVRFFSVDEFGLTVTEEARWVITREGTANILAELAAKWSDLEFSWSRNRRAARGVTERDVSIWVADVGSIARRKFGWCRAVPYRETVSTGSDIRAFADGVCRDLASDTKVALGFECPLFIPVPEKALDLGKARDGDRDQAWSAAAGCCALSTGLAESAWVFREIRRAVGEIVTPSLSWGSFHSGDANLFVWEAFITGGSKALTHEGDAEVAARAFLGCYPDRVEESMVTCESPLSLAATAMNWAGFHLEQEALGMPCIVLGAGK